MHLRQAGTACRPVNAADGVQLATQIINGKTIMVQRDAGDDSTADYGGLGSHNRDAEVAGKEVAMMGP